jgi:hypothetical protein
MRRRRPVAEHGPESDVARHAPWERALQRVRLELRPRLGGDEREWIGDTIAPFQFGPDALGDIGDPFRERGSAAAAPAESEPTRRPRKLEPARLLVVVLAGALIGGLLGLMAARPQRRAKLQG